jgi:hypothetical protein
VVSAVIFFLLYLAIKNKTFQSFLKKTKTPEQLEKERLEKTSTVQILNRGSSNKAAKFTEAQQKFRRADSMTKFEREALNKKKANLQRRESFSIIPDDMDADDSGSVLNEREIRRERKRKRN